MSIFARIRDRLAQIDEVVPVLIFFEIIYLAVGQLIIWAFLPVDKPYVAIGFAIGVGFAMLSSIQNSMILGRALSRGKRKAASAGMVIFMLIRIAAISGIIVLALRFKFCSPVAVLVGVLAIQAGVYFEPAVRKRRERKRAAENTGQIPDENAVEKTLVGIHSADSLRQAQGAGGTNALRQADAAGLVQGADTAGTLSKPGAAGVSKGTTGEVEAEFSQETDENNTGQPLRDEYTDQETERDVWNDISPYTEDSSAAADETANALLQDIESRQETDGLYETELQKNLQKDEQGQKRD